jgi:PAS domain-containing protein
MDLRFFRSLSFYSLYLLALYVTPTSTAFAVSGFIEDQSTGTVAALVYALLFVITVLLITPVVQFYFSTLKQVSADKERHALHKMMIENKTGAVYVNSAGKILFANSMVKTLLKENNDIINRNLDAFLEFTYTPKLFKSEDGKPVVINTKVTKTEARIILTVGESLLVDKEEVRLVSLFIPTANSENAQGFEHLLTECEELTSSLKATKEDIDRVMLLSPVAIGRLNKDHQIISANKSLIKRLKYSEEELKKGNIYKLFSNSKQAELASEQLKEQKLLRDFHAKLIGKNGKDYPGEITIDLVDQEKEEYLFWIINRSDEQFQYEKFEALLQNNQAPVAIVTSEGMTKANRSACQFFNVASDDLLRGIFPYAEKFNDNDEKAEELEKMFQTARDNGGSTSTNWTFEINDKKRPCQIKLIPIFKDNQFDSVLFLWTDLTELQLKTNSLIENEAKLKESLAVLDDKQGEVTKLQEQIDKLGKERENIASQLSSAHDENELLRGNVKELTLEKENSSSGKEELQVAIDSLDAQLKDAESNEVALKKELENFIQHIAALEKQQEEASEALAASKTECAEQRDQLEEVNQSLRTLQNDHAEQQAQFEKATVELEKVKTEVQSKAEKLDECEDVIFELKREKEKTADEVSQLNEKVKEQQEILEKAKQNQQAVSQDSSAALNQLQEQLDALTSSSEEKQKALVAERQQLQDELSDTQRALQKANQSLEEGQQLSEQRASEEDAQSSVIDNLKKQIAELETQANAQRKELLAVNEQLEAQVETEHNKATALEANVESSSKKIDELKAQIQAKLEIIADFEKQSSEVNAERQSSQAELQSKLSEANSTMRSLQSEIDEKEAQQKQLAADLEEQQKRANEYAASVEKAEETQAALQSKLVEVEKQLEVASKSDSAESNDAGANKVVLLDRPDVASAELPAKPSTWFDFTTYWSVQTSDITMTQSLLNLFDDLDEIIKFGDAAIDDGSAQQLILLAQKLTTLSKNINSEPLIDLAQSIEFDCSHGMDDNAVLRWYPTRLGLERSRRVVYDHIQRL